MRNAQRHADTPRIVNAVQGAATGIIADIAAYVLIFVGFNRNADNLKALLNKQCCGNGRIHAARHTDKDALRIAFHGKKKNTE
jgi:hypothetical protein